MRPTITKLFCQVFFGQRGDFNTKAFYLQLHHDSEDKVDFATRRFTKLCCQSRKNPALECK